jgi:hypothetical protein
MLGVRVERRRDHLTYLLSTASDAERSRKSVGGAIADSQALMARLLDAASPRSDIWDWLDRPSIIREIGKNPERITLVPGSSLGRAAVGLVHMLQLGITSQVQRRDVFMA